MSENYSSLQTLEIVSKSSTPVKQVNLQSTEEVTVECKTPSVPQQQQQLTAADDDDTLRHESTIIDKNESGCCCKCKPSSSSTPDRLKVPKPFKYPERYTSPTDHMMSPISKGLLARGRRGGALLPPSMTHSKVTTI